MKTEKINIIELTDQEADYLDTAWQDDYGVIIDDPWYGTKIKLMDFVVDQEEGGVLPPEIQTIYDQIKDLKDNDSIKMLIGM